MPIKKYQIENLQIVDADIASGAAIATTKLAEGGYFVKKDGTVPFTADQSMGGNKLTNLAAPVSANDAVRLVDLQNNQAGLSTKEAVRAATTANITLSGAQTIDGVSVIAGDRVLVKDQTTASTNGIYVAAAGAWTRAADADTTGEVRSGMFCFVQEGTTNADSGWVLSTDGAITLGTTSLAFVQFSGAGQISAGTGMSKSGNTLNVGTASSSRIVVNADDIDLALVNPGTAGNGLKITADNYGRVTNRQDLAPSDIGAQPADSDLTAIAALATNGIIVKTGAGAAATRTITGTAGRVSVTAGDGVSGNPTVDLVTSGVGAGTYNSVTVDTFGRVTAASNVAVLTAANFVIRETPSGTINGTNAIFTLANTPTIGTEEVYKNGILCIPSADAWGYSISGATITFVTPPVSGEWIRVNYLK